MLTAEVAGLSRDNIDIHAEESRVVIRGERSHGPVPCEQFHRVERGHGRFQRAFMLPEPIDVDSVVGGFEGRTAHRHAAEGRRPRSPSHRCHMIRKILLTFVLVVAGFVAGLVVTGRMRTAADSRAETAAAPEPQTPAPRPSAPTVRTARVAAGVGPDFTRIAAQAVKGVANISSLQVVRRQNSPFGDDPFFQYFFWRPGSVRIARSPIARRSAPA